MSGNRHATPDDWITLLREFSETSPDYLQVWLDATASSINIGCWKSKSCTAHVFLAAHLLTVVAPAGVGGGATEAGPVTERTIHKLQTKYADMGMSDQMDAHFNGTKYGRNYLTLRRTLLLLPMLGKRQLDPVPVVEFVWPIY